VNIFGVSHIAITVRDLERSVPFYRDVLGMRVVDDREETVESEKFGGRRRLVNLAWEGGAFAPFLSLDQRLEQEPAGSVAELFDVGIHHVALWTNDLDSLAERANAAGATVVAGPFTSDTGTKYGDGGTPGPVALIMLRDPDGNYIEIDSRV
jgi:catechol 2,3-dioxygenase-like lactoylglutathione lyase family enzyme